MDGLQRKVIKYFFCILMHNMLYISYILISVIACDLAVTLNGIEWGAHFER